MSAGPGNDHLQPPQADPQEPNFFPRNEQPYYMAGPGMQVPLPRESTINTLGQVCLILFAVGVLVGFVMGIVVVIMASNAMKIYKMNPTMYTQSSYKAVKGALTRGIIAVSLGGGFLIFLIIMLASL